MHCCVCLLVIRLERELLLYRMCALLFCGRLECDCFDPPGVRYLVSVPVVLRNSRSFRLESGLGFDFCMRSCKRSCLAFLCAWRARWSMHVGEDFISAVFIDILRDIAYIYKIYALRWGPACSSFRKHTATWTCQYIYIYIYTAILANTQLQNNTC